MSLPIPGSQTTFPVKLLFLRRLRYIGNTCGIISKADQLPKELPNEEIR